MEGDIKGPCRFGLHCTRAGCWYEHPPGHIVEAAEPVICRYGASCKRKDCFFVHSSSREFDTETVDCTQKVGHANEPDDRVCVWFQKGRCKNGSACNFQHVQQERDGNVIVVRNLPKSLDASQLEQQIRLHFHSFGYITRVQVKTDLDNRCRGFAFVVFADADSVKMALQAGHPVWDIKCKVDLPMYIEGQEQMKRRSPLGPPMRNQASLRLPFSKSDRVLLLGEGDFSFTLAAVSCGCLDPSNVVATSPEPPRTSTHVEVLRNMGVQCLTQVYAESLVGLGTFDVIAFNFPHTGEPSVERNQDLLKALFKNSKGILKEGGRVAVTLKPTYPYSEWKLTDCAEAEGFMLSDHYGFPAAHLCKHGYTHTTTDRIPHQVEFLESAITYEFAYAS